MRKRGTLILVRLKNPNLMMGSLGVCENDVYEDEASMMTMRMGRVRTIQANDSYRPTSI